MEYDRNLFGEIKTFVKIQIEGVEYEVPDRLEMLRVFQFLQFSIDYARLCWNASCQRCYIDVSKQGKNSKALSCRLRSSEGMSVLKLPSAIKRST
jgi:NADH dehydrogenase/NADH:ubiquinone oxidoreductase subunit G